LNVEDNILFFKGLIGTDFAPRGVFKGHWSSTLSEMSAMMR
jgi:hypothetical protein